MKKPATLAWCCSDCFVQKDKHNFEVNSSFYNLLVQNKDWPPLPAPSPIRPTRQGKKPAPLEWRCWVNFHIDVKKFYFEEIKQQKRDEAKNKLKRVSKRQQERNYKRQWTKERKQWREWNAKVDQHADKLDDSFQQIGQKSESEKLKDQIKKEVIEFKEQLKDKLEQQLIKQVEQFEKEWLEN